MRQSLYQTSKPVIPRSYLQEGLSPQGSTPQCRHPRRTPLQTGRGPPVGRRCLPTCITCRCRPTVKDSSRQKGQVPLALMQSSYPGVKLSKRSSPRDRLLSEALQLTLAPWALPSSSVCSATAQSSQCPPYTSGMHGVCYVLGPPSCPGRSRHCGDGRAQCCPPRASPPHPAPHLSGY